MAGGIGGLSSSGPSGIPDPPRLDPPRRPRRFRGGRCPGPERRSRPHDPRAADRRTTTRAARPARAGRADGRGADRLAVGERRPWALRGGPRDGCPERPRRAGRAGSRQRPGARGHPGHRPGQGRPAPRRLRARASIDGRLAGRSLVDPRTARRRGPADPPDGPARARGAARRDPRHEEPRAARRDGLPGQRQLVAGPRRRAVSRRRPAQRRGHHPRPQPPERRPDALPGRPAPDRGGPGCRPAAGHRPARPPRHRA